jgi:penicillin-binding protein 1A
MGSSKKIDTKSGAGIKLRPEAKPGSRNARIALAILKWGFIAALALGALGAASLAGMFWFFGADPKLPKISKINDYHPKQVTRIYSADGKLIGEIFEERRRYVALDKVAPVMLQAIIDSEDADFYNHHGLDFSGMVRALLVNIRHGGKSRQGASTITQQVVKTFLLTPEKSMRRKVQEMILARRLESELTKEEILTLYLNQIYFGHGRYGIEEAARFYFGKSSAELVVPEAAMLAGMVQSPERLSPVKHPNEAKGRQDYVLNQMNKHGHLSDADLKKYVDAPIPLRTNPEPALDSAPEVVDLVRAELVKRYGAEQVSRLGIDVQTTIDYDLEVASRQALEAGLEALDARHGYRGPITHLGGDKLDKKLAQLKKELGNAGGPGRTKDGRTVATREDNAPRGSDSYEAIVLSVDDAAGELVVDLGGWKGAVLLGDPLTERRYNPEHKKPSARFAPGDVVEVRLAPDLGTPKSKDVKGALMLDAGPQGAVVIIDPATRQVLAVVGGYGFQAGGFNRATRAKRQPGSSFKPYLYAAAIDSGKFTAASVLNDAPEVYDLWKPKNYEAGEFRGPTRLRTALALSINTVAIRLMHDVGPAAVIGIAHAMGISEELPEELSLALGSGVVTPMEHINALASFPAGGVYAAPTLITRIGDSAIAPPPTSQALRPETAFVVASMMQSVVEEGTAVAAKKLKRKLAGKTGTSNGGRDTWFVGFTPDLVAGVWVGFDDMRAVGRGETGAKAALPIWIDLMKVALKNRGQKTFKQPAGVVVARVDRKTGKLAAPGEADSETLDEVFVQGTVPTEIATGAGEADPSTFVLDQMDDEADAAKSPGEAKDPKGGGKKPKDVDSDEAAAGASDPIQP